MATERRSAIRCGAPSGVAGSGESAGTTGAVDWRITNYQAIRRA
jgi:hypothetical protein